MSYLEKNLLPDEAIAFQTRKNVIIFLTPLVWTLITLFFLLQQTFTLNFSSQPFINNFSLIAWIPGILALLSWLNEGLTYLTSVFIITNRRVIMREGFFIRHAVETRLSAVAEITINQSLLGRLMNYGTIGIKSFGGGNEFFPLISSPYDFQNAVSQHLNEATQK